MKTFKENEREKKRFHFSCHDESAGERERERGIIISIKGVGTPVNVNKRTLFILNEH